jgi:murein DD-endopeptidase MepM/ murein hydrolase activator NlpD
MSQTIRVSFLVAVFLLSSIAPLSAKIQIPDNDDEYFEIDVDEASDTHFFLEDVNDDLTLSADAQAPSILPCEGVITSSYGWRRISKRRSRLHKGVDIAAPVGTPIHAPADAVVAFVGRKGGYGRTVILNHGGELTTLYGHNSQIFVSEGELVKKGQEIARIGMSGRSTGPHVHYEVRVAGSPVNPSKFF